MPLPKVAKPKKAKKWKPPAMAKTAEHQQHIGGPYQAPATDVNGNDFGGNESGV